MSKIQKALRKLQEARRRSEEHGGAGRSLTSSDAAGRLGPSELPFDEWAELDEPRDDTRVRFTLNAFRASKHIAENPAVAPETTTEFRRLADALLAGRSAVDTSNDNNGMLVLVTAAVQQEGRTFVCLNLALTLLQSDFTNVLLVDADIEHPETTNCLGLADTAGFTDLFSNVELSADEVIAQSTIFGLNVLPVGQRATHSLLSDDSRSLASVLKAIVEADPGRCVIVDMPTIEQAAKTWDLSNVEGHYVAVVRAGESTCDTVMNSLSEFGGSCSVSLLLNQV